MEVLYDSIGQGYDTTRKADPAIAYLIYKQLNCQKGDKILDLACGSGNYTLAMQEQELDVTGVDISFEMLGQAERKNHDIQWVQADVTKLPFKEASFKGAICTMATHHMHDLEKSFLEAKRVLRSGANLILFTTTVKQMHGYWLWEYFPEVMERATSDFEKMGSQQELLEKVGFCAVSSTPYFVGKATEDLFLYAGKERPELYLDSKVRAGIGAFAKPGLEDSILEGSLKLRTDINSGRIQKVMHAFENATGDCLLIKATR